MSSTQMEALDFRYLLLEYYKKLRINENELSVILMIDHLLGQKNNLVTPDILCLKMNLSIKELDKIFVDLIEKGYLLFDTGKKIKISLKPLQKKLLEVFEAELAKENEISSSEEKAASLKQIYNDFEKLLKRSLSPLEVSIINDWSGRGYTASQIVDALKECLSKGKKTFKSIDKVLLQWQARDDIEKAGVTATSDKWDKNIEKTMQIAKAKWIDD
ncbi:MAG: DnaD domain protein [Firmicutes bacterium]|nr:DnaD domain protein [Candidatus Fiminaster equi]